MIIEIEILVRRSDSGALTVGKGPVDCERSKPTDSVAPPSAFSFSVGAKLSLIEITAQRSLLTGQKGHNGHAYRAGGSQARQDDTACHRAIERQSIATSSSPRPSLLGSIGIDFLDTPAWAFAEISQNPISMMSEIRSEEGSQAIKHALLGATHR